MSQPVIITAALTGSGSGPDKSPYVPVTPQEIAADAIASAKAGAAAVHVHVRDPQTKAGSTDLALYRETTHLIRASGVDVVLNLTTGMGARFVPDREDPTRGGPSTTLQTPARRIAHVLELRPEICSLDFGSLNFGDFAFLNTPPDLREMADGIMAAGVTPEIEVFELGHVRLARDFIAKGLLPQRPLFQLCLGIPWGAPATPEALTALRAALPPESPWSAFGVGRAEFPIAAQTAFMGGHIRIGLEDNLYAAPGQLARSNAELVTKAVDLLTLIGQRPATPQEARDLWDLPSPG